MDNYTVNIMPVYRDLKVKSLCANNFAYSYPFLHCVVCRLFVCHLSHSCTRLFNGFTCHLVVEF